MKTARCRCELRYVPKFTAASRGHPCHSTALVKSGTDLMHTATRLVVLVVTFLVGVTVQKAQDSVVSNLIGMKFVKNDLRENTHRLTVLDFRFYVTLLRWQP